MERMNLSGNQLSGPLDAIYGMIRLKRLQLRGNQFESELYGGFGFMPLLTFVDLGGNLLSGSLDAMFSRATSIEVLKLDGNAFQGGLPDKLTLSTKLLDLRVQGNELDSMPDLTSLTNLDTLDVSINNLSFEDLVPNEALTQRGAFRYTPQDTVPTFLVRTPSEVEIFVLGNAPGNRYQWYRDGQVITGATSDTLRVDLSAPSAAYHSVITNDLLPDLTLTSRPIDSDDDPTSVASRKPVREETELLPNYPNPFTAATWITFKLPAAGHIEISIFDLLGRRVRTLVNRPYSSGEHRIFFDARELAPGLYQYRLDSGNTHIMRVMSVVR